MHTRTCHITRETLPLCNFVMVPCFRLIHVPNSLTFPLKGIRHKQFSFVLSYTRTARKAYWMEARLSGTEGGRDLLFRYHICLRFHLKWSKVCKFVNLGPYKLFFRPLGVYKTCFVWSSVTDQGGSKPLLTRIRNRILPRPHSKTKIV